MSSNDIKDSKDNTKDTLFDFNSAINLFPNLVNLINLTSLNVTANNLTSGTSTEEGEIRNSKVEIGRAASSIRIDLAKLKLQANQFTFGNLSLDQQELKILNLKKDLNSKKAELEKLVQLFPSSNQSSSQGIETIATTNTSTNMETD